MSALIYPICRLCGQVPAQGLHDGFRLRGVFICSVCRKKMLTIKVGSTEYDQLFSEVRQIIFPRQAHLKGLTGDSTGRSKTRQFCSLIPE